MVSARTFLDILAVVAIAATLVFVYQSYKDDIAATLFGEQRISIFIRDIPVTVAVADTPEERDAGLSGESQLAADEGMLFVFPQEGYPGFWMKDMLIPLDIIWIDNNLEVVHIERNVRPESYPAIYTAPRPARFVLEVNAFFVATFNVNIGDRITIPAHSLPVDLRQ